MSLRFYIVVGLILFVVYYGTVGILCAIQFVHTCNAAVETARQNKETIHELQKQLTELKAEIKRIDEKKEWWEAAHRDYSG